MKTSIVIPVMNDSSIYKCLNSIIDNIKDSLSKDREIIVVDDKKSKKDFSKNLKSFCKKNKIIYYHAKKPGASFNRNKGIGLSKGDNILFIDSDCFADRNWIYEMERSLEKFDIVEGRISYESKETPLFDRFVENKSTPNRFLTANLGIKKIVSKECKFDDRFIVFREDTDFGLSALEKGFKSTFNKNAEVYHKQSRFTIKKFIFERKRYIGESLLFKKHKHNKLIKRHVPVICKISHPLEFILTVFIIGSFFFTWKAFVVAYFIPGIIYSANKYIIKKRTFKILDTILILILLPITMIIKRIYIWKGSIKFKILLI